ncbi:GNAT family N-acetyltransferase [Tersicoccus sp. MR15.9]|uniref:GNAT family N-acetyltransferase n=1 Tax=Tersicoccus mangrovi TaxID=3121635 RepID=UPI002FE53E4B
MSTDPVIRAATVQDADGIAAVHVRSWQQTYAPLVPPGALDDLDPVPRAAMWRRVMGEPENTVLVALVAGRVVGFAAVGAPHGENPPRERELVSLYVLAEHHGTGVGAALLDAALGAGPASLWVADPNPRAQAFYRRHGFARDGTVGEHPLAGHPVTEVRMIR